MRKSFEGSVGKNVAAIALVILAVFSFYFSVVCHAEVEDGLVAHYKFDGDANDAAGNWASWAVKGNESYSDGARGQSLHFDGETYWKIDDTFPNYQEFTVSMWVNPTSMDDAVFYGLFCGPDGDAGAAIPGHSEITAQNTIFLTRGSHQPSLQREIALGDVPTF